VFLFSSVASRSRRASTPHCHISGGLKIFLQPFSSSFLMLSYLVSDRLARVVPENQRIDQVVVAHLKSH
jgi:hypothetical protein